MPRHTRPPRQRRTAPRQPAETPEPTEAEVLEALARDLVRRGLCSVNILSRPRPRP